MPDLFGRVDQVHQGGLSADSLFMTWPGILDAEGGLGLLVQNVGITYRQGVRRIHEIGPGVVPSGGVNISGGFCDTNPPNPTLNCAARRQPVYYIAPRPEGMMNFGRIFGVTALTQAFFGAYGNPCSVQNNITLQAKAGCNGQAPRATTFWDLTGVLVDTYAMNATAQEMVLQEQINAQVVGVNLRDTTNNGPAGGGSGNP